MVLSRSGRQSGVTLVEMLIAVALLGFILLGIAPLFLASVKSNYSASEYTSVTNLGRDKLEELMNLPVGHPDLARTDLTLTPHPNDLAATIDPLTGRPALAGTPSVANPFQRRWGVSHFQTPDPSSIGGGLPFPAVPAPANGPYDFMRVDVQVVTDEGHLGIGRRRSVVSGYIQNPRPGTPPPTPTP